MTTWQCTDLPLRVIKLKAKLLIATIKQKNVKEGVHDRMGDIWVRFFKVDILSKLYFGPLRAQG